jgi:type VI secretion system protein VasD
LKTSTDHRTPSVLVIAALLTLLNACASAPEPAPAPKPYEIRADADAVINRDIAGKPLSVVVRLYQLKQEKEFDLLTFDLATSTRTDAELFGDSLIKRSEILMVPGTTHISTQMLLPETKYLGVVAFFRRPDPHYWRYLIDADQIRNKGLSFEALDCHLRLKDIKAATIPGQPLDAKPSCLAENIAAPVAPTPTTTEKTVSEKPKKHARINRTKPSKTTSATPTAVNHAPAIRTAKPVLPLPTPPEPTSAKAAASIPAVNINVSPSLGLPKWGVQ